MLDPIRDRPGPAPGVRSDPGTGWDGQRPAQTATAMAPASAKWSAGRRTSRSAMREPSGPPRPSASAAATARGRCSRPSALPRAAASTNRGPAGQPARKIDPLAVSTRMGSFESGVEVGPEITTPSWAGSNAALWQGYGRIPAPASVNRSRGGRRALRFTAPSLPNAGAQPQAGTSSGSTGRTDSVNTDPGEVQAVMLVARDGLEARWGDQVPHRRPAR